MRQMLLAATALAMLSGAAYAQSTANSGSNSTLTNTTTSGSQASATGVSNPVTNVIGNPIGNGASSSTSQANSSANTRSSSNASATGNRSSFSGRQSQAFSVGNTRSSTTINYAIGTGTSGGGTNGANGANAVDPAGPAGANGTSGTTGAGSDPAYGINYSGGYSVRNVPEVVAPSIVGGNPCAIGASGGLALSGFGITGGATWADKQCERRQQAALLYNIGRSKAAVELMCQDDNVRAALRISGEPCVTDQTVAQQPAPVAVVPLAPAMATPATPVATPVATQQARPEWCYTASFAELRHHSECDVRS